MKNINKYLAIYSVILSVAIFAFYGSQKRLKAENLTHQRNIDVLMDSATSYKVLDSLNAYKIGELQLKLSEYEKYRKEDAELIKKLKAGKLQTVNKTETRTEYVIKTELKDTIIYKDTVKTINYKSRWTDLSGHLYNDTAIIKIVNREELMLVESLEMKKFLGVKLPGWLFGYKHGALNVVSKNPNTTIQNVEHIKLR